MRQTIDFNLTSKAVEALCAGDEEDDNSPDAEPLPTPARKIAKATKTISHVRA